MLVICESWLYGRKVEQGAGLVLIDRLKSLCVGVTLMSKRFEHHPPKTSHRHVLSC